VYVYVKPNNDFLAIHHQGKVLNGKDALFSQLLMMGGGNYSTRYLVGAIALAKHLKGKYKKLVIAGLSQGGNAALMISLQVEPDVAIIASGFSVLNSGPVYIAGINQIVIPGFLDVYTPEYIANVIGKQSTQYLFSFGEAEAGIYGYESIEKMTEKSFDKIKNIQFVYHPDAHVFPTEAIVSFLKKQGL
jgi:esterase/lipase